MFKKMILIAAIVCSLGASDTNMLENVFEKTTKEIVKVVKNKKLSTQIRNDEIIKIITPMFDFKLMAKLSLGKKWRTMDKEKQSTFVALYVKRMKKSYSSKVDKYTNERIAINSVKQVKATRIVLNSSLIGKDTNYEIIYKYYKPKKQIINKDLWLAYDVIIEGVSIIKTDKAQFKAILQESTIDQLLEKLK